MRGNAGSRQGSRARESCPAYYYEHTDKSLKGFLDCKFKGFSLHSVIKCRKNVQSVFSETLAVEKKVDGTKL